MFDAHNLIAGRGASEGGLPAVSADNLVMHAAVYTMLVEPFCAGFDVRPPGAGIVLLSTLADVCHFAHLLSSFVTGYSYMDEDGTWKVEMRQDRVVWRYLQGSFLLDIVTCLPVQIGMLVVPEEQSTWFFRVVGFAKGIKAARVDRETIRLLGNREVRGSGFGEARATVSLLLLCHWVACAWFWCVRAADESLVPYPEEPLVCEDRALLFNATEGDRYLCALGWASQTMGGVGNMEMRATTGGEAAFTMAAMVVGAFGACLLLSTLRGLWAKQHLRPEELKARVRDTMDYLHHRRVPGELVAVADSLSRFRWETTRGHDDLHALKQLPYSVQIAAFRFVHADIVHGVEFLEEADEDDWEFWRQVLCELRSDVFVAGSWVFREGGPADRVYIVKEGTVELVQESSDFVYHAYRRGEWFGETSDEVKYGRKASARAVGHCTLLELTEASLKRISQAYPRVLRRMSDLAVVRIRRNMGLRWRIVWKVHREAILQKAASITRPLPPWPCPTIEKYRALCRRLEAQVMKNYKPPRTLSGASLR